MRTPALALSCLLLLPACATTTRRAGTITEGHPLGGNGLREGVGLVQKGSEGVLTAGMGEIRYDLVSIALKVAFGARKILPIKRDLHTGLSI